MVTPTLRKEPTQQHDICPFGQGRTYDWAFEEYLAISNQFGEIDPYRAFTILNQREDETVDQLLNRSDFGQAVLKNAIQGVIAPFPFFLKAAQPFSTIPPDRVERIMSRIIEQHAPAK